MLTLFDIVSVATRIAAAVTILLTLSYFITTPSYCFVVAAVLNIIGAVAVASVGIVAATTISVYHRCCYLLIFFMLTTNADMFDGLVLLLLVNARVNTVIDNEAPMVLSDQ